jgi:hypothetical protein
MGTGYRRREHLCVGSGKFDGVMREKAGLPLRKNSGEVCRG